MDTSKDRSNCNRKFEVRGSCTCKQKLEDDNLIFTEDQNTEWQISDAFKIRFMNTRIFWIVTVHVVVGLYIWLMS